TKSLNGVVLHLEIELELLFDRLADRDFVVPLNVRDPLQEEDALDQIVGVLHLVDGLLVDMLPKALIAPVLAHLRVDEVLIDRGQFGREDVVEMIDDLCAALHGGENLARPVAGLSSQTPPLE